MEQTVWKADPAGGELTTERDGLRIAVSAAGAGGAARFQVLRLREADGRPALVQSGHCPNVRQAMQAAERAAGRLAALR